MFVGLPRADAAGTMRAFGYVRFEREVREPMFALCPEDLGLILTYRCHSGCKHCLYNCGPRWEKEPISSSTLHEALEAVCTWTRRPQVHLTGGEPFLCFERLLEGTQVATELGLACYVETSASWCTDEAEAVERFTVLREAGLQAVLISCSPFHAERIPPLRTMRAIHAAIKVFGPRQTIVYLPNFIEILQRFDLDRPTPLARYEEEFGAERAGQILWGGYGIISGGRAGYRLGHLVPHYPVTALVQKRCARELLHAPHSHFDLYGHFIASFCGGLTVGDWHDLPQLLDDFQAGRYPPLVERLIEYGPHGLFEWAQANYDYHPLPEGYTGKCHLCVDVRRHLVQVAPDDFPELRPRGFYTHL